MSFRPSGRVVLAVFLALGMLLATGCNVNDSPTSTDDRQVRLYGSDGNMTTSFGATFKEQAALLNGMRGTAPLTQLSDDFKQRLKAVDPRLTGYLYAAEAYDAVMLAALAAETARSVEGPQIARYMTSVTVGKDQSSVCETLQACLEGVRSGKDIAYRGVSMRRSGFTDGGEPSSASYGTLTFGKASALDDDKTEYVAAGDEKTEAKELPAPPTGARRNTTTPLKIGSLLPKTGDLAIAGPPIFAAVRLAVNELNAAGGVLGMQVGYIEGDDGTSPTVANVTADQLISAGVQVIIGAAGSSITKSVLDKVAAAQRVLISPSATSDELTTLNDNGYFFRTAPPDIMQSKALTDVVMRYGPRRIVIVARDDSYGVGLGERVAELLRTAGIKAEDLKVIKYQVRAEYKVEQFADLAKETTDFTPDSVLVIGFEESGNVIKALSARGMVFHD